MLEEIRLEHFEGLGAVRMGSLHSYHREEQHGQRERVYGRRQRRVNRKPYKDFP